MKNNYFSHSLNKKKNIIIVSFAVVMSVLIVILVGFILFAENWEHARLTDKNGGYADIPTLDKKGLDYFVGIKNQNVSDSTTILKQETPQPNGGGKNIGE